MYRVRKGIRENISKKSRSCRRQQTQTAPDLPRVIVAVNYVDGLLVVVAVAFASVPYLNVPIQSIAKDTSPQAKHLID